jgi:hypothetical protein
MPDSAKNFSYDGTNGPISTTTVTRAELITAMEHLNYAEGYNIRAIDELAGSGFVSVDSLGNAYARSISGDNGLSVSNATGISGNPTIGIGTPSTVRQAITDTEANAITSSVAVSILSTGTSYAVPAPDSGKISTKTIINNTSSMITLTGAVWENPSINTVRVAPRGSVTLVSGVGGFWHAIHPYIRKPKGAIFVSTPQATTITTGGSFYEDNGVYELNDDESTPMDFALGSDSRLVYTGKVPIHAHLVASVSMTTNTSPAVVGFRFSHYDDSAATTIPLTHSLIERKVASGGGGDQGALALHGDCMMEENDYLTLTITHPTNGATVTTEHSYMFVMGTLIMTT